MPFQQMHVDVHGQVPHSHDTPPGPPAVPKIVRFRCRILNIRALILFTQVSL